VIIQIYVDFYKICERYGETVSGTIALLRRNRNKRVVGLVDVAAAYLRYAAFGIFAVCAPLGYVSPYY
jgi:hypothetical protein